MTDIKKRINKLEEEVKESSSDIPYKTQGSYSDLNENGLISEADFSRLLKILWLKKLWILSAAVFLGVIGFLYVSMLPNEYRSTGMYAPVSDGGSGFPLAGQYGKLASVAGFDFNEGGKELDQAILLGRSRAFLESLIEKRGLAPQLLAVKRYSDNEIGWDVSIYDPSTEEWKGHFENNSGLVLYYGYKILRKNLLISKNDKANTVDISYRSISPEFSLLVVNIVFNELNDFFRDRAVDRSNSNISYLKEKVDQTGYSELRSFFFGAMEEEIKKLMLAEAGDGYLLRPLAEPLKPVEKIGPNRGLLLMLFVFFGGGVAGAAVLILSALE